MNVQEIKDRLAEIEAEKARLEKALAKTSKWKPTKPALCWVSDIDISPSIKNIFCIITQRDDRFYQASSGVYWKYATPLTRSEALALIDEPKKPSRYDWSKIPKEYGWAATDANGSRYAYLVEMPYYQRVSWNNEEDALFLGRSENGCPDWRDSLEARPSDE